MTLTKNIKHAASHYAPSSSSNAQRTPLCTVRVRMYGIASADLAIHWFCNKHSPHTNEQKQYIVLAQGLYGLCEVS